MQDLTTGGIVISPAQCHGSLLLCWDNREGRWSDGISGNFYYLVNCLFARDTVTVFALQVVTKLLELGPPRKKHN